VVPEVTRAGEPGWSELKNGALPSAAEIAGFDVLLSGDKMIQHEQNMAGRKIALVYMSDNQRLVVKDRVAAIGGALPGMVTAVDCGAFVPRRFRKRPGPFS